MPGQFKNSTKQVYGRMFIPSTFVEHWKSLSTDDQRAIEAMVPPHIEEPAFRIIHGGYAYIFSQTAPDETSLMEVQVAVDLPQTSK